MNAYLGFGAALEAIGIVLIAWPDVIPYTRRLAHGLRRLVDWVRRRLGIPRHATIHGKSTLSASAGIRSSGVVGPPTNASLDEKVEWLIDRERKAQEATNELAHKINNLEKETSEGLKDLRKGLQDHCRADPRRGFRRVPAGAGLWSNPPDLGTLPHIDRDEVAFRLRPLATNICS